MSDIDKKAVLESINAILVALGEEPVPTEKQEQEPKPWPQIGDGYWHADSCGDASESEWEEDRVDHYRLATGNCHRTEAEALAYREWQTDPRVVARGMIERMEGFDPRGEWFVYESGSGLAVTDDSQPDGGLRFNSLSSVAAAAGKHPDLCKVALGVITDKEEGSRIVREAMGRAGM